MKRRDFIALLGGAAATWPIAARAQQPVATPAIGYLGLESAQDAAAVLAPFRRGLAETGFVEGQNLRIEYRFADGLRERLPDLASDLVRRRVNVIVTSNTSVALAAKAATSTVPIVFYSGDDPVRAGLVNSLNRPAGNATGVTGLGTTAETKRIGLLKELVPVGPLGALVDPQNPNAANQSQEVEEAARTLERQIRVLHVNTAREIDTAFTTIVQQRIVALTVTASAVLINRRHQIATLAAHYRIPTVYGNRLYVEAGGLISYSPRRDDLHHQTGIYVGRILKGDKAGELPVVQVTKFELFINLKAAKDLDLDIPPTLLAIADEVIE
jgi:putative ABC transport system substrate-binding protein